VLELRGGYAAERREAARDDHGEPVGAGIHHARVAQDRELLGSPRDRLLAGLESVLEHLGKQLVLLLRGRSGPESLRVHVREVVGDAGGHRPDCGEHRALGGVAHRCVRRVRCACERRGHQHRVHQLTLARGELLGRSAHDLGEDHPAVAARAEQRCARHGAHDLVAVEAVDRLPVEVVERIEHRPHRQRHVVPRVTIGDRKDVQVVDLLPAGLELAERSGNYALEAIEALVLGHGECSTPFGGRDPARQGSKVGKDG
jgi:hypothetical protein